MNNNVTAKKARLASPSTSSRVGPTRNNGGSTSLMYFIWQTNNMPDSRDHVVSVPGVSASSMGATLIGKRLVPVFLRDT